MQASAPASAVVTALQSDRDAGDGWSPRAEDAVLHGCVPVVIQDNVHMIFESILDWEAFSIRVPEAQIEQLPQLLLAITPERLAAMQAALAKVWHRFAWFSHGAIRQQLSSVGRFGINSTNRSPKLKRAFRNDAHHTLVQWLAGRMNKTTAQSPPSKTSSPGVLPPVSR